MDVNAFWTGAAAAATVVAALVSLVAYLRGRTRVVVQVVCHDYTMPPALRSLLKNLEDFRSSLPGHAADLKSDGSSLRELFDRLTALIKEPAIMGFTWREPAKMWSFKVTNHGHERAEKLELQVPDAIQSLLIHSDGSTESITGGIIHIPELRPGESIAILSWAPVGLLDVPRLLQARGRATMRAKQAAAAFGVQLRYLDVLSPKDIETAFQVASKERAEAVLTLGGPVLNPQRRRVVEFAAKSQLPAMYTIREYVEAGGLMSYGVSVTDLDRRAATYVDKILKGAKPGDLPVEQPTRFEFIVNPESCQADRPEDSAECASESESSDPVIAENQAPTPGLN